MPEYLFDDVIVASDDAHLQAYLAEAHEHMSRPQCRCRPDGVGVPMYVAKIGKHFVLKRMPNTGGQHAPGCVSYEVPPELSGLAQVKGAAIQEDVEAGTTTLRLDFSLLKTGTRPAPTPSGAVADTVHTDGSKLTLRATLHYLWEEAGLNRGYPSTVGKRNWAGVRRHLLRAANGKVSKGEPLGRSLYVPEPFSIDDAAGINQRRIAHMAELTTATKARKLMIAIGEVKELVESRSGFKIVAKHLPDFPFMLGEDIHRRLQKRFANELALWDCIENSHLIFIATFGLTASGTAYVDALATMVVNSQWIPFEHAYDLMLLDLLSARRRRFVKGLRYNLSDNKPLATAVLTDVEPSPIALYVQPPGVDDADEEALSALIEESEMPSWVWNAGETMPELPVPYQARRITTARNGEDFQDMVNAAAIDAINADRESAW